MNVKESWVGSQRSLMLWLSCWALSRDQKGDVKGEVRMGMRRAWGVALSQVTCEEPEALHPPTE